MQKQYFVLYLAFLFFRVSHDMYNFGKHFLQPWLGGFIASMFPMPVHGLS